MKQDSEETYYASPIENIEFTEGELRRMKIVFIDSLSGLNTALVQLGVLNMEPGSELISHGYTLSPVGPLNNTYWAIHSIDSSAEFVSDVWNKRNFYTISKETEGENKIIFNKVHLRLNHMEEDLARYIKLNSKYEAAGHEVFSDYIQ